MGLLGRTGSLEVQPGPAVRAGRTPWRLIEVQIQHHAGFLDV